MRFIILIGLIFIVFPHERAKADQSWLAREKTVSLNGKSLARLYALDSVSQEGTIILNPGGLINASAMNGLAEAYAKQGHIVFVLENQDDLAIKSPGLSSELARLLRNEREGLEGIPKQLEAYFLNPFRLTVIGHSLGGAVLGEAMQSQDLLFDSIILFGVSQLVKKPALLNTKVLLLVGENDGLALPSKVEALAQSLNAPWKVLPELNHFCIISDKNAGSAEKRAQDGLTSLTTEQCIAWLVEATISINQSIAQPQPEEPASLDK